MGKRAEQVIRNGVEQPVRLADILLGEANPADRRSYSDVVQSVNDKIKTKLPWFDFTDG